MRNIFFGVKQKTPRTAHTPETDTGCGVLGAGGGLLISVFEH